MWGSGTHGELGVKHRNKLVFPLKIVSREKHCFRESYCKNSLTALLTSKNFQSFGRFSQVFAESGRNAVFLWKIVQGLRLECAGKPQLFSRKKRRTRVSEPFHLRDFQRTFCEECSFGGQFLRDFSRFY